MALFDETTPISEVTVNDLVGEGKKFSTVDDLAKGKAESDRVIRARETELAQLRDELSKRESLEALIERTRTPQSAGPVSEQPPAAVTPSFTEEDLEARIRSISEKTTQAQRAAANAELVSTKLNQVFGTEDKANEVVNAKARELGVNIKFLEDMAVASPDGFLKLLGVNDAPRSTPQVPHSNVNAELVANHAPGPKPGTYPYYQALQREMQAAGKGADYYSPKIQNQLMKDAFAAEERGENFFGT